jgi:galactokinase
MTAGAAVARSTAHVPESVAAEFVARFGAQPRLFRAPARVNIIGEYTDFNDGLVLPVAIGLYSWVAISPRPDRCLRAYSSHFDEQTQVDVDRPATARGGRWTDYVAAVVASLRSEGLELRGADVLIQGDIPLGGGLSSSASLEVSLALALLAVAGVDVEARQLALMCQRAEVEFVGVGCGIMDQYAIACGHQGMATLLDCRSITHQSVALPPTARILVIHSGIQRRLQDGAFNRRRAECAQGLRLLQERWPGVLALRDLSLPQIEEARVTLGDTAYRRCRHVVSEIERVRLACQALRIGAINELGALITASHTSLRDDFEVSCPELDALVEHANRRPGVLGARMVGAGFGGCMLTLLESSEQDRTMQAIIAGSEKLLGKRPWHYLVESAGAASEVMLNPQLAGAGRR